MTPWQLTTPVALIIFKRPDTTKKVFEAIRQAKPQKLLIIADGARPDVPGEAEKCAATRTVVEAIDWNCEVLKNYSPTNLGCGIRVSSGLDWVFANVEAAIILEDDCLPDPSFFRFCQELLARYKYDRRIMSISALSIPDQQRFKSDSYFFSRYQRSWGWATWRRAWQYFDFEMNLWSVVKDSNWLEDILDNSHDARDWTKIFDSVYRGDIDTWDYQWMFSCWLQRGLSILPRANLVTNIGFGTEATHTNNSNEDRANLRLQSLSFPLQHPQFITRDLPADSFIQANIHRLSNLARIKANLKQFKVSWEQYFSPHNLSSSK